MFIDAVYYTLKGSTVKRPCILPYIGGAMWAKLRSFFDRYPAQEKVAQLMVLHGFRVHDNRIYAAAVELSDTAIARAAGGDRRVIPTSASKPGLLAGLATAIAEAGVSIRQVIVDDPEITDDPHAFIITEQPVPERLLPKIKAVEGVKSVV